MIETQWERGRKGSVAHIHCFPSCSDGKCSLTKAIVESYLRDRRILRLKATVRPQIVDN